MPDTATDSPATVTSGELYRAVTLIRSDLSGISTKLDSKVEKADQVRKDTEQDSAIERVSSKVDKIIWAVALFGLTAIGNLIANLADRGIIQ